MSTTTISQRIARTSVPIVVTMGKLIKKASTMDGKSTPLTLAQGQVYWDPPEQAINRASSSLLNSTNKSIHRYGADDGSQELKSALKAKLRLLGNDQRQEIMVSDFV
jgi:hypothetical protein